MDEREAIAAIALAAVASDGEITQPRVYQLSVLLPTLKHFHGLPSREVHRAIGKVVRIARMRGLDLLLETASREIPPELKAPAFAAAVGLIEEPAEGLQHKLVTKKIQKSLGLTDQLAREIVSVVEIQHRA